MYSQAALGLGAVASYGMVSNVTYGGGLAVRAHNHALVLNIYACLLALSGMMQAEGAIWRVS